MMWAIIVLGVLILGFCITFVIKDEKKTQKRIEEMNQVCSRCCLYETADTIEGEMND